MLTRHSSCVLLLLCLLTVNAHADFHSYILQDTPHATNPEMMGLPANTILTYNESQRLATTTFGSDRLSSLGLAGEVDAISYGTDFGEEGADHTFFFFSIRRTASGRTAGLPHTPLFNEPPDESEADIFIVNDKPTTSRDPGPHMKIIDENTASAGAILEPPILFAEQLGLTGLSGRPSGTPPHVANVAAFTYNTPSHARTGDIYFSVGRGVPNFHPASVYKLTPAGVLSVYQSATELGLTMDDNIDGLAVDATGIIVPYELGWYSLDRASPSLTSGAERLSAADLFRFETGQTYGDLLSQLYMTAESIGLQSHFFASNPDADVDSIGHIDPAPLFPCLFTVDAGGGINVNCASALAGGFYTLLVNDKPQLTVQGTQQSALVAPFAPGAYDLVSMIGQRGGMIGVAGSIVEIPSSVPAVTGLGATVTGATVTWSWTPGANYTAAWARLDNGPIIALSATDTTYTPPAALDPGMHVLEVHGVAGGVASPASFSSVFLPASSLVAAPDDLDVTPQGTTALVEWMNVQDSDLVEVLVDCVVVGSVSSVLEGPSSATIPLSYGAHTVTVRATVGSSKSLPTSIQVLVPLPLGGDEVQSASFSGLDPAAIAVVGSHVYVAERQPGTTYRYVASDLSSQIASITSPGQSGFGPNPTIEGLATDGTSLYWIINEQLTITGLDGSAPTPPLALPGLVEAGGATIDAAGRLWVADLAADRLLAYWLDGTPTGDELAPNEGGALGAGVAARPGDFFDVVQSDVLEERFAVVLNSAGDRRARTPLLSATREVVGLAWTAAGTPDVASFYAIDAANNEVVEIVSTNPGSDFSSVSCHGSVVNSAALTATGPWPVPDDGTPLEVPLSFSMTGRTVADVEVVVEMQHDFVGDVRIELQSPTGTIVVLRQYAHEGTLVRRHIDDLGSNGFDDVNGTRPPDGATPLSTFDGETVDGTWLLRAVDQTPLATGTIEFWSLRMCFEAVESEPFERGDCNADATTNIADAVRTLTHLFPSGPAPNLTCLDRCDSNDDGRVDIADAVYTLTVLFPPTCLPGACPEFAEPNSGCGADSTIDGVSCSGSLCP
ncbi:MAG: proprotein convertase P-domain-containing protein [Planctomycetota bacterium]